MVTQENRGSNKACETKEIGIPDGSISQRLGVSGECLRNGLAYIVPQTRFSPEPLSPPNSTGLALEKCCLRGSGDRIGNKKKTHKLWTNLCDKKLPLGKSRQVIIACC
jgi:hypothetical protein